ncbi:Putative PD-(D/E)XK family member [Monaibacterium marinum]|uniref:PD-(D/E)XK family member n=1 Tax=Pontivivens marinum TaxID=1690039 RepID=A0A2C9CW62_9RHOB|nr:PD-(D/E)XK motif protein [Monaibacterium marinum]SOH95517.1 Putative PD-(D/E)XK family member [Monaibacterium marinum]
MSNDPWKGLAEGNMRRVDAQGKHDFFWATVENKAPALLMGLGPEAEMVADLPALKNIVVQFRTVNGRALVISLLDNAHREIFETLCRDIVTAAECAPDQSAALDRVIRRTRRWHFLLKGGSSEGLSKEEQRGLVGELAFLREISTHVSPETAIEGWTGPEGAAKDFEFPAACIEVKARRGAAKPYVRISSEDQLSDVTGQLLFLRVYDVDSAVIPEGDNLHGHVENTVVLFEDYPDCLNVLEERLEAVGYERGHDYEKRRWIVGTCRTFAVADGFPRITPPLTSGVHHVTYAIDLTECTDFITEFEPGILAGEV